MQKTVFLYKKWKKIKCDIYFYLHLETYAYTKVQTLTARFVPLCFNKAI
jgi:hypothetical protein